MDGLRIVASIIAVLQLTERVIAIVDDVQDAGNAGTQWGTEASRMYLLLGNLRYGLEEKVDNELCYAEVRKLGERGGVLEQ